MKKQLLLFFFPLMLSMPAKAQYAFDVLIDSLQTVNQTRVEMTTAYNGWIYAAVSLFDSTSSSGGIDILRSKDGGTSWNFIDSYYLSDVEYTTHDIIVAGTDTNALTVFVSGVNHNISGNSYTIFVDRYNGTLGTYLGSPLNIPYGTRAVYDIKMATDYNIPAVGSLPYSVALVYSCFSSTSDSINYILSLDGGQTFPLYENVATTARYFRNVSISYGRSSSASNGRYFIAWDQFQNPWDVDGHIYSARNISTIDDAFTVPTNLDSVESSTINYCRRPRISTQASVFDNDSTSLTAVVLVERDYQGNGSDIDVLGFYNKKAHTNDFWTRLDVNNNSQVSKQGDIAFNLNNTMFEVTYFDSTNLKLAHVNNDFNLTAPSAWNVVSDNYSDLQTGLLDPNPVINANSYSGNVSVAWTRNNGSFNQAFFDAYNNPNHFVYGSLDVAICDGDFYTFDGTDIYTAGTYYDTLASATAGIDSVVIFTLTVNPNPTPTVIAAGNDVSTQAYAYYQWHLDGTDISGANSQSYTCTADGYYSVYVIDLNGCVGNSDTVFVNVNDIPENGLLNAHVYPNPVKNFMTVDPGQSGVSTILLFDEKGAVVFSKSIAEKSVLNLDALPAGNYSVRITNERNSRSFRIVKE
ncbi:MAG: T9SS type A sorting domain-containing protein [Bacteroidia bacterium]